MTRRKQRPNPHRNVYVKLKGQVYRVLLYYNRPISLYNTKYYGPLCMGTRLERKLFKIITDQIKLLENITAAGA